MEEQTKQYEKSRDFFRVCKFLSRNYKEDNKDGNWLRATWLYMHSHPYLDENSLGKIRLYESDDSIYGVVHYESDPGEVFFETRNGHQHLKPEMLSYAEAHLKGIDENGKEYLRIFINDFDVEFEKYAAGKGYHKDQWGHRPMSKFVRYDWISDDKLPSGFKIISQSDENDILKMHKVLWYGFNHQGEPPLEGIRQGLKGRVKMQSVPGYDRNLKIIVMNENNDYVCFCGFWYDDKTKVALIEPMATHPEYRRKGLGRAALYEGIRRCVKLGAKEVFVGSDQEFYLSIGFEKIFTTNQWVK